VLAVVAKQHLSVTEALQSAIVFGAVANIVVEVLVQEFAVGAAAGSALPQLTALTPA
jgi:hypothetical protein